MFRSLAPARRRLALTCCAVLVLAVVAVGVSVVVSRGNGSPARAVPDDRPGPVLLVPGYGGSTGGLAVLATRLRQHGKDAEVVSLPGDAQGDLAAQARVLAAAARAVLARTGAPSVDVVGYSAGGVVARLWLRDDAGAPVRRVITLGSPQHGTQLATLGALVPGQCPVACQQLDPASDLLARLNGRPGFGAREVPAEPAFVSLWTSRDEVVLPPESAVLTGAVNIRIQSVCPASAVSHAGLPRDGLVAAMVLAELQPTAPVRLAAGDCARLSPGGAAAG